MLTTIRRHLSWKLFVSYLAVVLVGILVLATATGFAVPTTFERHMATMGSMMAGGSMMGVDLFASFRSAVNEALAWAGLAALCAAVVASLLVSRRVVLPVQGMMAASQRIADGHYDERVAVHGDLAGQDLDELGRLALSFNQMAARLEQTEARRLELIGTVAHELRTPLATIQGYMEGLIDGVLPPEESTFQQVAHEAGRMQRLVRDLQELSRVEAGAIDLHLESRVMADLVSEVTTHLRGQFEEKGVTLDVELETDLPPVWVDGDRIKQVLLNLVGNALQYTPIGGQVTVGARRAGDWLNVWVKDTGIGIPAEHLPHLFERFYRVDRSRSRAGGGSGIGLTVARRLVDAHGGQIEATSQGPGRGSNFGFTLPLA